jgi:hypothetical protein
MTNVESVERRSRVPRNNLPRIALGLGAAGLLALPLVRDLRLKRSAQPLTDAWRTTPIAPRGSTLLGISFRSPQPEALGLESRPTLQTLLTYPFQLIRLGAYWNRVEPRPGDFDPSELDWQVEAAMGAGKQIILCVGALKTFSYPEFYVPAHRLARPIPEHTMVTPDGYPSLLSAATAFIERIVDRYKSHAAVVAWQVENEAADPLGFEHSWRLDRAFIAKEVDAIRRADPSRPILMNGFLPTALPGMLSQWWQTRDQGDSLSVAQELADIVGIDYYPRSALAAFGERSLYLAGATNSAHLRRWQQLFAWSRSSGKKLMVSEGQAEPWEAVTVPPNLAGQAMYSCLPDNIVETYNGCLAGSHPSAALYAYLFWGAEYWVLREQSGDPSYLGAFARILEAG